MLIISKGPSTAETMKEIEAGSLEAGFSSTKKGILLLLKRAGNTSLGDIAKSLRISKMAALKHLTVLESKGIVERSFKAEGRGRPKVFFKLGEKADNLFPEAYAHMTLAAFDFIDERLGRAAVVKLLKQRTRELYDAHHESFDGKELREKVETLAEIRDEGGYMAELGPSRKNAFELLEYNCPIRAIAGKYGEACTVEIELFKNLLHADVDATHRVVAGDAVCRFMIRKGGTRHE